MRRFVIAALSTLTLGLAGGHALLATDSAHADPNAPLAVTNTAPSEAVIGQPGFLLKVYGDGFPANVNATNLISVLWNGVAIPAMIQSSTEIQIMVGDALLANAGTVSIGVQLSTGESVTAAHTFQVYPSSSDANCDSKVTSADSLHIMRVLAGDVAENRACSLDANRDGVANINDANWVRQEVAKLVVPKKQ